MKNATKKTNIENLKTHIQDLIEKTSSITSSYDCGYKQALIDLYDKFDDLLYYEALQIKDAFDAAKFGTMFGDANFYNYWKQTYNK